MGRKSRFATANCEYNRCNATPIVHMPRGPDFVVTRMALCGHRASVDRIEARGQSRSGYLSDEAL